MPLLPLMLLAFGLGAAVLTWVLVGQLIRLAPRLGLLDRPNARSSHTRPTPRGGGIGFVLAMAVGVLAWLVLCDLVAADAGLMAADAGQGATVESTGTPGSCSPQGLLFSSSVSAGDLLTVLGAALFIAAISLRDDFKSLGAGLRFACHFTAAGIALWAFGPFTTIDLPVLGHWPLGPVLGGALTVVWIVGLTNVYNFMDGVDGIAGVQGVVAGGAWLLAGVTLGAPTTAALGALLVGGCGGFLGHNWSPARIFMGDVGSAFLGFLFAVVPLVAAREVPDLAACWPVFAGLVVWPFVGDGFLTFVRRALRREKVWEAHRSHLYQRLVQSGWKHALTSELYAAWAALTMAVAWLWLMDTAGAAPFALLLPPVSLAGVFWFVRTRERAAQGRAVGR